MPPRKDSPQPGKRELRRSLVEAEILEVAARTFAERGFGATSLDAIASELGLHRVSLYHYFDSKNAVLVRLVTDMLESSESAVEEVRALRGAGPGDRLRGAVGALLRPILEAPHRFRLFLTAGVEQSPELKDRAAAVRRVVVGEVTDIIRAGQASGEFRTTDVELAVFAILGMCNWVAWWPRTVRDKRPALADQLGRLAVAALAGGGSRTPDGPSELIASLQTDLERLAAMLGEDRR